MRLGKLRSLSPGEYAMVLAAGVLLPAVNGALRVLGFQRTFRVLHFLSPRSAKARHSTQRIDSTARCVRIAARHGPYRATCLRESLVAWWFLRWRRIDAALAIGVDKDDDGFSAHAWVVVDGAPLKGQEHMAHGYAPIFTGPGPGRP